MSVSKVCFSPPFIETLKCGSPLMSRNSWPSTGWKYSNCLNVTLIESLNNSTNFARTVSTLESARYTFFCLSNSAACSALAGSPFGPLIPCSPFSPRSPRWPSSPFSPFGPLRPSSKLKMESLSNFKVKVLSAMIVSPY